MPTALYLKTREHGVKKSRLILITRKTTTPIDKQVEENLLCLACEDRLNKRGEAYALSQVHDGKDFPLLDRLKVAMPLRSGAGVRIFSGEAVGVDTDKLAHFALGVFWKASVHVWRAHDGSPIHHSLGQYEEQTRRYLLQQTGFPADLVLVVTACTDYYSQNNFYFPCEVKGDKVTGSGMLARGIHFRLYVGADLPRVIRESCCVTSFRKPIYTGDCIEISRHAFLFLQATSRPSKGMRGTP